MTKLGRNDHEDGKVTVLFWYGKVAVSMFLFVTTGNFGNRKAKSSIDGMFLLADLHNGRSAVVPDVLKLSCRRSAAFSAVFSGVRSATGRV